MICVCTRYKINSKLGQKYNQDWTLLALGFNQYCVKKAVGLDYIIFLVKIDYSITSMNYSISPNSIIKPIDRAWFKNIQDQIWKNPTHSIFFFLNYKVTSGWHRQGLYIKRQCKVDLGLSKDPPEPTHPLPPTKPDPSPTELTASAVSNGFHSPKPEINELEIGSPPLKSEKPDPTDPSFFRQVLRFFWVDLASFEFSLGRFKLVPTRFR